MYIAKMHSRYPEFYGVGYYNFIISDDEDDLEYKIERNSHDFIHEGTVKTRHRSAEAIVKAYPTKEKLNARYFKG